MAELRDVLQSGIVFDLDGTLVHSAPDIVGALGVATERIRQYWQGKELPEGATSALLQPRSWESAPIGPPLRVMVAKMCPEFSPADVEIFVREYRAVYDTGGFPMSSPYPKTVENLSLLATRFPLYVITNKAAHAAEQLLEALKLRSFFQAVYSPTTPPENSPLIPSTEKAPMLQWLCAEQQWVPEGVAYVGDTFSDMFAAREARTIPVAALWGYDLREGWDNHWPSEEVRFSFASLDDLTSSLGSFL